MYKTLLYNGTDINDDNIKSMLLSKITKIKHINHIKNNYISKYGLFNTVFIDVENYTTRKMILHILLLFQVLEHGGNSAIYFKYPKNNLEYELIKIINDSFLKFNWRGNYIVCRGYITRSNIIIDKLSYIFVNYNKYTNYKILG